MGKAAKFMPYSAKFPKKLLDESELGSMDVHFTVPPSLALELARAPPNSAELFEK